MTVRGEGCMADTHSASSAGPPTCNGHTDQRTAQRSAGTDGHTGTGADSSRSDVCDPGARSTGPTPEQYRSKAAEVEDDLPLGSEANTLRQGPTDGVSAHPPVDRRLWSLRQGAGGGGGGVGGGGGGSGQLLHSGWTSFNSDVSNLTSGSNHSANSVEWLLQERQVDPEQVLLNLGFGTPAPTAPTTMYTRIPDRFLHSQAAQQLGDEEVDLTPEGPLPESAPGRSPSRALTAWSRARSMSTALLGLKLLTSMQHADPLTPLFPPLAAPPSLAGSSGSQAPPPGARSVLHPDNQRALARQGFYGDMLPEGLQADPHFHTPTTRDGQGAERSGRKESAEDRRRQFHKTRSKHCSLVESGEEELGHSHSRDDYDWRAVQSVDFSTTTESTDSGGELSTSSPPTPGDVFLDLGGHSLMGPAFPGHRTLPDRDLPPPHHPHRSSSSSLGVDSDVTPCASRQPTLEKAPTLTPGEGTEEGREGGGSRTSSTGTDPAGRKTVSIIVSEDSRRHQVAPSSPRPPAPAPGGRGGMNFLNIVQAAVDRLSDSGSEHTLVDQQSSSSGSPRPGAGTESPRLCPNPTTTTTPHHSPVMTSQGSGSRAVEAGPVLYVYHRTEQTPAPDENDNLPPHAAPKQGHNLHPTLGSRHGLDEELPRMSSVQSDSSGFVDTEVSTDNTHPDMASLKVSNLGSSCESSATMASTATVVGNSNNHINSSFHHHADITDSQPSPQSMQDSPDSHKRRSKSADDILKSESGEGGERFITMCYIPHLNQPPSSHVPLSTIRDLLAASPRGGQRHSPRGPAHISVVLKGRGRGRGEGVPNEVPLSEELAQAQGVRGQGQGSSSSAWRQSAVPFPRRHSSGPQVTMTSVSRGAAQRVSVDTSSVEGSRGGSGDELEREDRSLTYSSWSRDLPAAASSLKSRRSRARPYPATDEESGASVEGSSVYSCGSTPDSVASNSGSPLLDCHKLVKLINQPTVFKGRKTRVVHYRPRRQLHDWPTLLKKKRLLEETRLAQFALQKFKTELNIMETSVMGRCHLNYEDLTQEDREDVEELQHLWAEVRQQATETEQLLTSRMKSVAYGNDHFNFLSNIQVLQRLIEVLKEQQFQRQLDTETEGEDGEEEEEWEEERGGRRRWGSWGGAPRYSSVGSWGEMIHPAPRVRGRYSSSTSHLPFSPSYSEPSYDQLRSSLVSELREEMRSNLHTLQQDLQKRDEEIHRLQLQLMMEGRSKRPRSTQQWSRSLPRPPKGRGVKETDV